MLAKKLFRWFKDNQMKDNTGKYYLILSRGDSNQTQIRDSLIQGSLCEKFLGVKLDRNLTFDQHDSYEKK